MLQSMGLQRVGHDLATERHQQEQRQEQKNIWKKQPEMDYVTCESFSKMNVTRTQINTMN